MFSQKCARGLEDKELGVCVRIPCTNIVVSSNSTQTSEMRLLGEAKRCRAELERLRVTMEGMEKQSSSEDPESEVGELRRQLLQAHNQLKAAEEREYETQHELKW